MKSVSSERYVVLFCAENFGFGPSSLAICVAKALRRLSQTCEFWFLGSGVALELARTSNLFSRFVEHEPTRSQQVPDEVGALGSALRYVVCAVSPDAVKLAQKTQAAVGYIEPLLWFFPDVPEHLSQVKHFFVQEFQSTQTHLKRLRIGHFPVVPVGWVLPPDATADELASEAASFAQSFADRERLLRLAFGEDFWMLNFGGVENVFTGGSEFPAVVTELALAAQDRLGCRVPLVCIGGGNSVTGLRERFGAARIAWSGAVSPRWARQLVRQAREYFLSCGLASLAELALLRTDGFGLPSQNYSQHLQIRAIRTILNGWKSFDWCDSSEGMTLAPYLPEAEGVERIASMLRRLPADGTLQEEILTALVAYLKERQQGSGRFFISDPTVFNNTGGADSIAAAIHDVLASPRMEGNPA